MLTQTSPRQARFLLLFCSVVIVALKFCKQNGNLNPLALEIFMTVQIPVLQKASELGLLQLQPTPRSPSTLKSSLRTLWSPRSLSPSMMGGRRNSRWFCISTSKALGDVSIEDTASVEPIRTRKKHTNKHLNLSSRNSGASIGTVWASQFLILADRYSLHLLCGHTVIIPVANMHAQ